MSLRNKIIRLAYSKPELREHLLPLVKSSASRLESLGLQRRIDEKYGENSANAYKAYLNALYRGEMTPASIVGGGLRDGRGVAEKWLKKRIEEAERAGNIGSGSVTVSKPPKKQYSETDGYFYYVVEKDSKALLWIGWTPSSRGADNALSKATNAVTQAISYGEYYSGSELAEQLMSNRRLSKLPAEKKSIASKDYNEYQVGSGWSSAATVGNSFDAKQYATYSTEHLTRKEMKIFAKFVKLTS